MRNKRWRDGLLKDPATETPEMKIQKALQAHKRWMKPAEDLQQAALAVQASVQAMKIHDQTATHERDAEAREDDLLDQPATHEKDPEAWISKARDRFLFLEETQYHGMKVNDYNKALQDLQEIRKAKV